MTQSIEATVPLTWDYKVDGFCFSSLELIATVTAADNRPVITELQMEGFKGYPSKETILRDLPDTLKGVAFKDLTNNVNFMADAKEQLEDAGCVFRDESAFESLFVGSYGDTLGLAAE
ncbi:hypothetical protein [Kiloniella majae]|uniref:hypothetical protein n=1 Tax=Kiloniella majae TaxID=1938558 RepID=UPI000A27826C|nr:hypothetical protein [Kiloniella majae]